jgi:GNAT superfamily N-acetyltransferase
MVGSAPTNALLVDINLREAMRCYSFATPAGEVREYPGVSISCSGLDYSVFNSAMLTAPVSDDRELERRLALAAIHYSARGFGWSCWICEDHLSSSVLKTADGAFARYGMRMLMSAPGMLAAALEPPEGTLPVLEYRRVEDSRSRFDFCDVACVVFTLPFRVSETIYGHPGYWSSGMRGYVGYWRDKPVAVVSTVLAGDSVGVYSLGTLPQHQRHGFGEALLRYALEDSSRESGATRSVLQSTPAGFQLYRRMGFRTVTRFRIYDRPGGTPR